MIINGKGEINRMQYAKNNYCHSVLQLQNLIID
jgi:hypothetical protein